jgi:cytochrome c oxidase assembly protein subunit 15
VKTLWTWLPTSISGRVKVFAWASLVSQILIIGTGGAVRLTGSGLGCPTWPRCTEDSFVSTPEMGIHGIIEFGNRLLTFLLIIIAIGMFLMVVRQRHTRPELLRLAVILGLGIPAQAVIGGITVLTDLNPYVVGLHYLLSAVLVGLAAWLLYRVRVGPASRVRQAPRGYRGVAIASLLTLGVSITIGILVTGSGPHAGDGGAARNNLDSEFLQHLHSWPSYVTAGIVVAGLVWTFAAGVPAVTRRAQRAIVAAVALTLAQIGVGLYQARNGLPELFVGIHMVLAAVLVAVFVTWLLATSADSTEATGERNLDDREHSPTVAR